MLFRKAALLFLGLSIITGCAEREEVLEGKRIGLRDAGQVEAEENVEETAPSFAQLQLPAARINASWTHSGGSSAHSIPHASLSAAPKRIWSANIGRGSGRRVEQAASPIIADGRIYTMDTSMRVSAISTSGAPLWSFDANSEKSPRSEASGGGLAYDNGRLAVATSKGEVILLNAANGGMYWRHQVAASIPSAPALSSDRVVVIAGDDSATALDLENGRIVWSARSEGGTAGALGNGSPAIVGNLALLPYRTGELQGVVLSNGLQAWNQVVSGRRVGSGTGLLSSISTDPAVVGSRVYAATYAGRMAAMDRRSGLRIWTAGTGAVGQVAAAGNGIFVLTEQQEVARLDFETGDTVWATKLPEYRNQRRSRGRYGNYGPLLAGGRLYVAGTDGEMRIFDPSTGANVGNLSIPGGAASAPVVAGGRLYVISRNGQLHAFQ